MQKMHEIFYQLGMIQGFTEDMEWIRLNDVLGLMGSVCFRINLEPEICECGRYMLAVPR